MFDLFSCFQCNTFSAIERARKDNKNKIVSGVFGSVCRHEITLSLCNIDIGEKYIIGYEMVKKLKIKHKNIKWLFYDISCRFKKFVKHHDKDKILDDVNFYLALMHMYALVT